MRLIRDNDVAAELVGVSLPRTRVIAFVVSSAYAALGGALWTLDQQRVSPSTYSLRAVDHDPVAHRHRRHRHDLRRPHRRRHLRVLDQRHLLDHDAHRASTLQGNLASQLNGIIFGGLLILTMLFAPFGYQRAPLRRLWHRCAQFERSG